VEEQARKKHKQRQAGLKAAETKGAGERSRAAKAAAWTRRYGKNDVANPFSRQNQPRAPASGPQKSEVTPTFRALRHPLLDRRLTSTGELDWQARERGCPNRTG
jgi:hypothetical protein